MLHSIYRTQFWKIQRCFIQFMIANAIGLKLILYILGHGIGLLVEYNFEIRGHSSFGYAHARNFVARLSKFYELTLLHANFKNPIAITLRLLIGKNIMNTYLSHHLFARPFHNNAMNYALLRPAW